MNKIKENILGFDKYCRMLCVAPSLHGLVVLIALHEYGELRINELKEHTGLNNSTLGDELSAMHRDSTRTLIFQRRLPGKGSPKSYRLSPETQAYMDQMFGPVK